MSFFSLISFLSLMSSLSFLCPNPDSLHLDFFSFSAPDMVSEGSGCEETTEWLPMAPDMCERSSSARSKSCRSRLLRFCSFAGGRDSCMAVGRMLIRCSRLIGRCMIQLHDRWRATHAQTSGLGMIQKETVDVCKRGQRAATGPPSHSP